MINEKHWWDATEGGLIYFIYLFLIFASYLGLGFLCFLSRMAVGQPRGDVPPRLLLGSAQCGARGLPVQSVVPSARVVAVHVGEF